MKNQTRTKAFILTNPRSGSTLFRLILNTNREIVCPPESGFLHWLFEKYKDWNHQDTNSERLSSFLKELSNAKKMNTWRLDYRRLENLIQQDAPLNYEKLTELIYWFYKSEPKSKAIVDKNNYYIEHVEDLKQIWPKAKYIHLIRDGRDVACSYKKLASLESESTFKPKLPSEIKQVAHEWYNNNKIIENFCLNYDSITIRYEDLVQKPKKTLIHVCDFLGVSFDPIMLRHNELNQEVYKEPKELLDWKRQTLEPISASKVGEYRRLMNPQDLFEFEQIAHKTLEKYFYATDPIA